MYIYPDMCSVIDTVCSVQCYSKLLLLCFSEHDRILIKYMYLYLHLSLFIFLFLPFSLFSVSLQMGRLAFI